MSQSQSFVVTTKYLNINKLLKAIITLHLGGIILTASHNPGG